MKQQTVTIRRIRVVLEETTQTIEAKSELEAIQSVLMTPLDDSEWQSVVSEEVDKGSGSRFAIEQFLSTAKKSI